MIQEVWVNEDYEELKKKLTRCPDLYPYTHYFDNGIIGSGTCIFSKVRIWLCKKSPMHTFIFAYIHF